MTPTPIDFAAVEKWQRKATELREAGASIRSIAISVGRSFSVVQRFLNPESKRRIMLRHNERLRARRDVDATYDEHCRVYHRFYQRWWKGERCQPTE